VRVTDRRLRVAPSAARTQECCLLQTRPNIPSGQLMPLIKDGSRAPRYWIRSTSSHSERIGSCRAVTLGGTTAIERCPRDSGAADRGHLGLSAASRPTCHVPQSTAEVGSQG
jgi:hypothetical protein